METVSTMEKGRALTLFQKLAYSLGNFAQGVGPAIVIGWLQYFYTKTETTSSGVVTATGAAFGTGVNLQEMYIAPDLMTPRTWDVLAEAVHAARSQLRHLVDELLEPGIGVDDVVEHRGGGGAGAGTIRDVYERNMVP